MSKVNPNKLFVMPYRSCKVDWFVENSTFLWLSGRDSIDSGLFSLHASPSVKWRIHLKVKHDSEGNAQSSVFLDRIPHSPILPPEIINMHVTITAGEKTYGPYTTLCNIPESRDTSEKWRNMTDIEENLLPFKPDTLKIQCYLLFCRRGERGYSHKNCPPGVKHLSEKLLSLTLSKEHADITIFVDNKIIKAHKCILSRNAVFNEYIKKSHFSVITLPNLDYQAVSEFINFLYSGSLRLLGNTSIAMVKCMEHFNSDILNSYYAPQEIKTTTKINSEKTEFIWLIHHFEKLEISRTITSPPIKNDNVNTTWRLSVSMLQRQQKNKKGDNLHDYVSIFAEVIEGDKPHYFCLEFGIANEKEEIFFPKKLLRCNNYVAMGFEEFVSKNTLNNEKLIVDGTLRIVFKVRSCDFGDESSVGCRTMSFVTSTYESSCEELSLQMEQLLNEKRYSDITVTDGIESFEAHKCILAARCPFLSAKIENMQPDNHILNLRDEIPRYFEFIVHYIYTGILRDIDSNNLESLKSIAGDLRIEGLQEECTRQLEARSSQVNDAME